MRPLLAREARVELAGGREPGKALPIAFRHLVKGYYCRSERGAAEICVKMADTVGDFLLEGLRVGGLRRVFGCLGHGINGIVAAIDRADPAIGFTQVPHGEQAAFMACAQLKYTGDLGVFLATSGPGAIDSRNGLYDTKINHRPVSPNLQRAGNGFEIEHQDVERYVV